ncbi:MAG: hypothetical protein HYX26_07385 [Acidobacteriales bacterium]|nr:hypothetical protein [Terriglobales bacterium]
MRVLPDVDRDQEILSFTIDEGGLIFAIIATRDPAGTHIANHLVAMSNEGELIWKSSFEFNFIPTTFAVLPGEDFLLGGLWEPGLARGDERAFLGVFSKEAVQKRPLLPASYKPDSATDPRRLPQAEVRLAGDGTFYLFRPARELVIEMFELSGKRLKVFKLQPPFQDAEAVDFFLDEARIIVAFQSPSTSLKDKNPREFRMRYGVYSRDTGETLYVLVPPPRAGILSCVQNGELVFLKPERGNFAIAKAKLP